MRFLIILFILIMIISCTSASFIAPYCRKIIKPQNLDEAKKQISILLDCVEDLETYIKVVK